MTNGLEDGLKYRSDLMSKGLGLPLDILSPRLFVQRMRASIEAEFMYQNRYVRASAQK